MQKSLRKRRIQNNAELGYSEEVEQKPLGIFERIKKVLPVCRTKAERPFTWC